MSGLLWIKGTPGSPYRPSNGTEGTSFEDEFCARCWRDEAFRRADGAEDGCEIIVNAQVHHVGEPGFPQEWTHDAEGRPTCTAFEEHDAARNQRREENGRRLTRPLFEE